MKRTFAFGASTSQGAWPVQEDGFLADPISGFFAIADGFGGRGAGDIAAKTALQELRSVGPPPAGAIFNPELRRQREAFFGAHKLIASRNQGRSAAARGGCSLLAARISESGDLFLTQCGACVALVIRSGRISPLLIPQSPPREEFQPLLPEQGLGLGDPLLPESRSLTLESGDILVLASGGLEWESESFQVELISQLSVRTTGSNLTSAASHIIENASLASQSWNRTLLLIERV